jgi:hypothetical protein
VRSIAAALRFAEGPKRTAAIAAWVQSLFPSRPPVLVGGAAVELFTGGAYTTGDLDFVGPVPADVERALAAAGFRKEGRHWIRDDGEIFLEFPGSALREGESPALVTVEGIKVLTLRAEDILVDRLAAWQFWNSQTDSVSAFLLWRAQAGNLDRHRLKRLVIDRKVESAFRSLSEFVNQLGSRVPSDPELEAWARTNL